MAVAAPARISSPTSVTPAQLAAMDVAERRSYFNSLPPSQKASVMSQYNTYRNQMNDTYMRTTKRSYAVCPPQSGNALNQGYALATQLLYNVPTSENAFLEALLIRVSVNLNFAAGTGATYALTAAGVQALITEIDVLYGNTQMRFRPYILKYLPIFFKWMSAIDPFWTPPTGFIQDTNVQSYLASTFPVTSGNQTWTYEIRIPLNVLSPTDVRGLLPIMSGETTCQVAINTAAGLMGNDPELFPTFASGGTGNAVTLQGAPGTVQVIACYRDGVSYMGAARQGLDLSGLPTVQWDIDPPLNNLGSGNVFRQRINKAETIAFSFLTLIDGVNPGVFSTLANLQRLELDKDSSGNNVFWAFGNNTNINVLEYFAELRRIIGQDVTVAGNEGIIPLVYATAWSVPDPDNMTGIMYMNTQPSGWTDINYGIQVGAVGSGTNGAPRVVNHLIYVNPQGLIAG